MAPASTAHAVSTSTTAKGMPHAARIARVRHLREPFQQPRDLLDAGIGLLAELVKSGRDRR
ncbi:hypothetical protein [Kitasatospora sp. NBC_01300]|uniref:hypothetical protein n=1 Tax=Kitasatospora sp. NBC_01300 TaxID=2903574 RepID=UPI002F918D00